MPLLRSQRPDPRRSTSYCSTVTIVFFVALCLLGVWMMSSPTVVTVGVSSSDTNSEVKQEVPETYGSLFEDSQGDPITNSNTATSESHSNSSKEKVEPEDGTTPGEISVQGSEDNKDVLADTSKTETYSDANGKLEGGEIINEGAGVVKEGRDASSDGSNMNTGSKGVHEDKSLENAVETANAEQNFDETKRDGQKQNGAHSYKTTVNDDQQPSEVNMKMAQDRSNVDTAQGEKSQSQMVEQNQDKDTEEDSDERKPEGKGKEQGLEDLLPSGSQLELLNETNTQNGAWSTQVTESKNEKELQASSSSKKQSISSSWKLCNVTAGPDYIPCLDNEEAIKKLRTTMHYEHRERHCPESAPTCLVPLPEAYKKSIEWPSSRDKIWYHNVPHTQLATVKGHQNWVKVSGEYLTFPGGGTQFKHGALHYIGIIQEALPDIAWGKRSRVILDVGCGVASFGGYLFDRDVLTMSLAPKDEHEAQVQFALERGIPAISAVMGTTRLPFPGRVFDVIHCARCRVPWHIEGGKLLLELNRLLRPGGYFVWSATPVYKTGAEDVEIWKAMQDLTKAMCWEMVTKTKNVIDRVGLAIYRKPSDNLCYEKRKKSKPPLCQESDDPNAAWNVSLQACMHKLPVDHSARGAKWPEQWPVRLKKAPYWLNRSQIGVYGKAAPEDFKADQEHWRKVVSKSYLNGMGIDWAKVRNVMDMRSVYGGFAAALHDMKLWVMNIVPIDSPDTLPIIYERGLFGMYHDWCESFSTYPRTYDLLHADHLFSTLKKRCKILPVIVEVDRILRPEGKVIIRDTAEVINEVERIARSLNWEIRMTFSKQNEGLLCVMKTTWRPKELERTAAAPNQDRRTGS